MGEVPLLGERVEMDEVSDINDGGAPSADSWEYADGDGRGVSTKPMDRSGGPFEGTRIGCGT